MTIISPEELEGLRHAAANGELDARVILEVALPLEALSAEVHQRISSLREAGDIEGVLGQITQIQSSLRNLMCAVMAKVLEFSGARTLGQCEMVLGALCESAMSECKRALRAGASAGAEFAAASANRTHDGGQSVN
jgi:hypothetical protein